MAEPIKFRHIKATYFKVKPGSNTAPRLNTRIDKLNWVNFDTIKGLFKWTNS